VTAWRFGLSTSLELSYSSSHILLHLFFRKRRDFFFLHIFPLPFIPPLFTSPQLYSSILQRPAKAFSDFLHISAHTMHAGTHTASSFIGKKSFFFFLVVGVVLLGFELKASHLLSRCSSTWDTHHTHTHTHTHTQSPFHFSYLCSGQHGPWSSCLYLPHS
jgi:hypothetical protein